MFKRRRNGSNSNSHNNSCTNSQVASILNSPSCNNAFLNGTGWSPSLNSISHSNTPQKNCKDEFRTPHKTSVTVGPMTPLTTNQLQTPVKIATEQCAKVTLTPKVANCVNTQSSPYTSVLSANTCNITSNSISNTGNANTSATFWSYPNLSLSQMGLDAEPPLAVSEIEPIFCNIFNPEPTSKLPELLKGSSSTMDVAACEKDITRMSPLSWLLSVSSQDTSLGLFDQSQQILSEYLSYNMEI